MNTGYLIIVLVLAHHAVDCTLTHFNVTEKLLNSSIVFNQTTTTTNKTGPFLCPLPNNNNEPSVYSGRTPYLTFLRCIYSRSVIHFVLLKDKIIKSIAIKNATNQQIKSLAGSSSEVPPQTEYDPKAKYVSTEPTSSRSTTFN